MKINRNIFWTENFFDRIAGLGIKYVCISPGSRSTSLTLAAASNEKFKCFVHIDERSSGFFALGLAKASRKPVIIITTSGTAAGELYPAVIEAYQQRIPLIICTADRPPELVGRGANQTINQENLYGNHIKFFKDAGLPSVSISGIRKIRLLAEEAYRQSKFGPVHINFPFRKPFEPRSYTDEITEKNLKLIKTIKSKEDVPEPKEDSFDRNLYKEILKSINNAARGLIIAGPSSFTNREKSDLMALAEKLNFPVLADASSQLRFGKVNKKKLVINYEGFFRSEYRNNFTPDLILQFGRIPSSKAIENFLSNIFVKRYIINEHGDIFDPWNNAAGIFKCPPSLFCKMIKESLGREHHPVESTWLNFFSKADNFCQIKKEKILTDSRFPNECRLIPEIINALPENTHLMISNSMPVRDFDFFAPIFDKEIYVHTNRGASGIDGIISTSLGIRKALNKPTLLITGDLAFYYDLNSLLTADKYRIPLVIVLINNNGGGIFRMLPISGYGRLTTKFFVTPHNLDFKPIVRSFNLNYKNIRSWDDLRKSIHSAFNQEKTTVLEIKANIKTSVVLRKKYLKEAVRITSRNFL